MNKKKTTRKKLLIVMSNADPSKPEACYAPLFQATVGAALAYDVEVVLTGVSVQLAIAGNAEKIEINLDTHSPCPGCHDKKPGHPLLFLDGLHQSTFLLLSKIYGLYTACQGSWELVKDCEEQTWCNYYLNRF